MLLYFVRIPPPLIVPSQIQIHTSYYNSDEWWWRQPAVAAAYDDWRAERHDFASGHLLLLMLLNLFVRGHRQIDRYIYLYGYRYYRMHTDYRSEESHMRNPIIYEYANHCPMLILKYELFSWYNCVWLALTGQGDALIGDYYQNDELCYCLLIYKMTYTYT